MTHMKSTQIVLAGCATVLIAACAQSTLASAQPPGFPDLNTYTQVPVDPYITDAGRGLTAIIFSTSQRVFCTMSHPPNPDSGNQIISCEGPLPGLQDVRAIGSGPCDTGSVDKWGDKTYGISHSKSECKSTPPLRMLLNPGQKISYGDQTCAVGDGGSIACIDRSTGEHGFVLQSSGSFSF